VNITMITLGTPDTIPTTREQALLAEDDGTHTYTHLHTYK
jgi:hypothetical protein